MKYILLLILVSHSVFGYCQTSVVDINANSFVYNLKSSKVLAVVSKEDAKYSSKLIKLNPFSGEVEQELYLGGDPSIIKLTTSNNFVYIAFKDIPEIKRISLNTFAIDKTINVECNYIKDIVVIPNDDNSIVTIRGETDILPTDIVMYRDGVIQPKKVSWENSIRLFPCFLNVNADASKIFCSGGNYEGFLINILNDGLEHYETWDDVVGTSNKVKSNNDLLYSSMGHVVDPYSDTLPILKARMPVQTDGWGLFDGDGFSFSNYHNCYVYAESYSSYDFINFFDPLHYNYLGSILINFDCFGEYWIRYYWELEAISENDFILLAYSYHKDRNYIIIQGMEPSSDATLRQLYGPGGTYKMEPTFDPNITEYTIKLSSWILNPPSGHRYQTNYPLATTKLIEGYSVPSADTLIVTAHDGSTQQKYVINYVLDSRKSSQTIAEEEKEVIKLNPSLIPYEKIRYRDKFDLILLDLNEFNRDSSRLNFY